MTSTALFESASGRATNADVSPPAVLKFSVSVFIITLENIFSIYYTRPPTSSVERQVFAAREL
jgi:hypothetical protein